LITRLSPALDVLINGKMREAQEGRIEWPDLDVETFVHLAKFAYYANYDEPKPVLSEAPPASPMTPRVTTAAEELLRVMEFRKSSRRDTSSDSDDSDTSDGTMDSSGTDSNSDDSTDDNIPPGINNLLFSRSFKDSSALGRSREWEELRGVSISSWMAYYDLWLEYGSPLRCCAPSRHAQTHVHNRGHIYQECAVPVQMQSSWQRTYELMKDFSHCPSDDYYSKQQAGIWSLAIKRRANSNPDMSFLPVFLTHVRLYILADKYDVQELRRISLFRLRLLLRGVVLFRKRILDLVTVVDEIFANTLEGDEAREVIVKYFACYIEVMRDAPEVTELLHDGGDFAVALVEHLAKRL
jgi:hypothetical protein